MSNRKERQCTLHAASGFTLTEMLLSVSLFAAMLLSVLSVFGISQQNYFTSIGVQQAQLSTTSVIEKMRDDLAGARIEGYVNEFSGAGKVFIKFRRLSAATMQPSAGENLVWEPQMYMYIWCFQNVADPCNKIAPPPQSNQLLLARASGANANFGDLSGTWIQASNGILIGHMDTTLGDPDINDPATYPFQVTIWNSAAVPGKLCRSTSPPDGNYCGGHICMGNNNVECEFPFSMGNSNFPTDQSRVASSVSLRLLTVGSIRGMGINRIYKENRSISFRLRNHQKGCVGVPSC